ncbi:unnamed protein product [Allacma fusca]|uniref:Uncharacterized protein n=1 Tax=Allacma fusca TaxID=39272 RepID=A0A8J2NRM0_9HEXA|nr:unnamed protein product [Allacma fusca]
MTHARTEQLYTREFLYALKVKAYEFRYSIQCNEPHWSPVKYLTYITLPTRHIKRYLAVYICFDCAILPAELNSLEIHRKSLLLSSKSRTAAAIIYTCMAVGLGGGKYIMAWAHEKPYMKDLTYQSNCQQYLRDQRLSGDPYKPLGLETISDEPSEKTC